MVTDSPRADLVHAVLEGRPAPGIPIWLINPMEWRMIDRLAGLPEGSYAANPIPTYRSMLERSGVCMVDQWIPDNPLTMGETGYEEGSAHGATTGADRIEADGMVIDSPEAVVQHIEGFSIPRWRALATSFDADAHVRQLITSERDSQDTLGPNLLKVPYSFPFPYLNYYQYGYAHYFTAYASYPDVIERDFAACADYCVLANHAAARAYQEASWPRYARLDHDMASAAGTLVSVASLERHWFPHFSRSIQPLVDAGIRVIWHCDGNLMDMVPRLLACGIQGFQGFEYEHGMDYERICKLKTRDGGPLLIIAGVSVTTTLPFGAPDDVRREMRWLVEQGPRNNLILGCSSSITPGVPWENLAALVDGFNHYRKHGDKGC